MTMARETAAEKEQREADEAAAAAVAEAAAGSDVLDVDELDKGGRVKVPASVGDEITFTRGVDVVMTKSVKDGHIVADNAAELAVLLGSVPGAELVEG